MALSEKDFEKQMEELKGWILSSVPVFPNESEDEKNARIERARTDKFFFARTYFPHYLEGNTELDVKNIYDYYGEDADWCKDYIDKAYKDFDELQGFSAMHKELFEIADIYNQLYAILGYRGSAKSTIISFIDEMYKTVFNLNKFTEFVCDTQDVAASEYVLPIKAELESNLRILHDFGEFKSSIWTNQDLVTKKGKRIFALGPKMGAKGRRHTGRRPDRIIIEDMENINSSKKKRILNQRMKYIAKDLAKSTDFRKWQVFFIGNYFSKKTIAHLLLQLTNWKHKIYPALIDYKGKLVSAWEVMFPTHLLLKEQLDDPLTFRTERMQKPDDEGATFNEDWFVMMNDDEIDFDSLINVTYHDPSNGKTDLSDYKATIVLGYHPKEKYWIVLYVRMRTETKWKAIEKHFDLALLFNSVADGVENVAFQATLSEDYEKLEEQKNEKIKLHMIPHKISKEVRISSLASLIERKIIRFRKKNSGDMNLLIEQFLDFPEGEHDDGPDAVEGAYEVSRMFVTRTFRKIKSRIIG